jgi:hydroxyacylglutathione hydrolase
MRNYLKISISVVTASIICFLLFTGWMFYQMRDFHALKPAIITDSLLVTGGKMSNMFIVRAGDDFIGIDAGNNKGAVVKDLIKFKMDPLKCKAIFLTHTDADHVAGLPLFKNAEVYLSHNEIPLARGIMKRRFLFIKNSNSVSVKILKGLDDNDSVTIDNLVIHAIATPGHTAGSMCYRIGSNLFTGDLCVIKNGQVLPMLKIFTDDMSMDSVSIRKVAAMANYTRLFTAHTGYTSDLTEAFKSWR